MTPPFGAYTALSAQLSGSLRHTHSRIAEFAEEIAFFGGEEAEKMLVDREYAGLVMHENRVLQGRWWHGCVEEGIVKWLWGSFGVSRTKLLLSLRSRWLSLLISGSWLFVQSRCSLKFQECMLLISEAGQKVRTSTNRLNCPINR